MIYFSTHLSPEWSKVLLAQRIEAQIDGWIAHESDHLSEVQQAQARKALRDFHTSLGRQWITIQSVDDRVVGVFRYIVTFLVEFTEPGRNGDEHREALIRDAYGAGPVDQSTLAKLRDEGERLHPALHGLAHVIAQVAPDK